MFFGIYLISFMILLMLDEEFLFEILFFYKNIAITNTPILENIGVNPPCKEKKNIISIKRKCNSLLKIILWFNLRYRLRSNFEDKTFNSVHVCVVKNISDY